MDFNTLFTFGYLVLLLLLTTVCIISQKRFSLVAVSLFSQRHLSQINREGGFQNKGFNFICYLLIINTQALLLLTLIHFNYASITIKNSLEITTAIAVSIIILYHSINYLALKLYVPVFTTKLAFEEISAQRFYFHITFTLITLILLPICYYRADILIFPHIFILTIIPFLVYLLRLLQLILRKVDLFHFFIYFCALEVLPLIILIKFLANIEKI